MHLLPVEWNSSPSCVGLNIITSKLRRNCGTRNHYCTLYKISKRILKILNISPNSSLPVSLPSKHVKEITFHATLRQAHVSFWKASDLLYVDLVPPPSHFSHLILERYQDSDLPLTSTEGTDTKGHTPHSITQRQAVVACQTIPLAPQSKARGQELCPESTAALCSFEHPLCLQHPCTYVSACIMNSLRATPSFYSEEIGSPITLSSFLQLNTDQLMTTNETLRDIHTGILEWCGEKEERREMDNKLRTATRSISNSREALSQLCPYWYLLKLATQAKVAGLI